MDNFYSLGAEHDYGTPAPIDPDQLSLFDDERKTPDSGVVWVDDERTGHCPHCGGILNLAPWPAG